MMARIRKKPAGIALFMMMSALAVLSVVVAELVYSIHMHSRLAYNYVDGLKAYYSAKGGYKLGLLRLVLYKQVKDYMGKEQNKAIAGVVGDALIEKVWNMPFVYPVPIGEDATMAQKDAIKAFEKESNVEGSYMVTLSSEGGRINLNNLLVTVPTPEPTPTPSPAARTTRGAAPAPAPTPSASAPAEVEFQPVVMQTLDRLLQSRKESDRDFAEVYRDVTGSDILTALMYYMKPDPRQPPPRPNLPDWGEFTPKNGPLYSLSEIHLIKGIDDTLFNLIEPSFTVFSTPGINVNTATKMTIWSLVPEMSDEDINNVMKARDDPEEGKPFESADKFWEAIGRTSAASRVEAAKERLTKAGLRIITTEESFKIVSSAKVGLSTRTIEAQVLMGRQNPQAQGQGQGQQPAQPQQGQNPQAQQGAQNPSASRNGGINLVYWRLY